jgi:hypothetical protein
MEAGVGGGVFVGFGVRVGVEVGWGVDVAVKVAVLVGTAVWVCACAITTVAVKSSGEGPQLADKSTIITVHNAFMDAFMLWLPVRIMC